MGCQLCWRGCVVSWGVCCRGCAGWGGGCAGGGVCVPRVREGLACLAPCRVPPLPASCLLARTVGRDAYPVGVWQGVRGQARDPVQAPIPHATKLAPQIFPIYARRSARCSAPPHSCTPPNGQPGAGAHTPPHQPLPGATDIAACPPRHPHHPPRSARFAPIRSHSKPDIHVRITLTSCNPSIPLHPPRSPLSLPAGGMGRTARPALGGATNKVARQTSARPCPHTQK